MVHAAQAGENPVNHRFERQPEFPWWTLALVRTGNLAVACGGERFEITPPCLCLARPQTPYSLRVLAAEREAWVVFSPKPEWARLLNWPERVPGWSELPLGSRDIVRELWQTLAQTANVRGGRCMESGAMADNHLERALLLAQDLMPARKPVDSRIQALVTLMQSQLREPCSVLALARQAHLSPSRLAHLFQTEMGIAPLQYLERKRMERAQNLLLGTSLRVREIAEQVGFADPYHFSTRFRRVVGCAPRTYRRAPDKASG